MSRLSTTISLCPSRLARQEVPARLASLILNLVEDEGIVTRDGSYLVPARYTHEQLGSMIGAKRVAVTRAFGHLQDSGCVQLRRRQIYVLVLATLIGLAARD